MPQPRAFRPTVLESLEDRVALSHAGSLSALAHHAHHARPRHHANHAQVAPISTPALSVSTPITPTGAGAGAGAESGAVAAPAVAAPTLNTPGISSAQFNSLFAAVPTAPAMTTSFQLQGGPVAGAIESQVFKGTGAATGLYAYAYQIQVNGAASSAVQGLSWRFNGVPSAASIGGTTSSAFVIAGGSIGNLTQPSSTAVQLSWQPAAAGSTTGTLFVRPTTTSGGVQTVTFVVISAAPPHQQLVNVQGSAGLAPGSYLPVAYAP